MPALGIITVLFRSDEMLEDFFRSFSNQTYKDFRFYLIDNSYTSETADKIHSLCSKFKFYDYEHINAFGNIGVAAGNNVGIACATRDNCEYILFCNNDIIFHESDVLSVLIRDVDAKSMVTPKIYYSDSSLIWMAGGYMNHAKALGVHYGLGKSDENSFNIPRWVTYAPTCFLIMKLEVIQKVGIMDERYFAYYDDTDFVFRAFKEGYRIWYEPGCKIYHKVSSSSGGDHSLFYIYYGNRNKIIFIRKHYSGTRKWYLILYYLLTRFFLYFWKFDFSRKKQLIKATLDGFRLRL